MHHGRAMKRNVCPTKASLLASYLQATQAFFDAITNLGQADQTEVERLTHALALEAARAREDVMDHDAVHGC